MGTYIRNYETPDPRRLENRARDATSAAQDADRMVRTVMGHLTQAVASNRDHQALVKAAGFAAQADSSASSALAAAREATTAAHRSDAEHLEKAADEAQGHATQPRAREPPGEGADHALGPTTSVDRDRPRSRIRPR
jgi:hypothetical protein